MQKSVLENFHYWLTSNFVVFLKYLQFAAGSGFEVDESLI